MPRWVTKSAEFKRAARVLFAELRANRTAPSGRWKDAKVKLRALAKRIRNEILDSCCDNFDSHKAGAPKDMLLATVARA
eukprot:10620734-Karenia_brevis.AAC.1